MYPCSKFSQFGELQISDKIWPKKLNGKEMKK